MKIDHNKNLYNNELNDANEFIELELIEAPQKEEQVESTEITTEEQNDDSIELVEKEEQDDLIELVEKEEQDDSIELVEKEEQDDSIELFNNEELAELDINTNKKITPQKNKFKIAKKVMVRTAISIITAIVLLFFTLLGAVVIINYGPSETARNLFVNSVMESSAGKFMATCFFSDEKIKEIREQNSVVASKDITNSDLIEIDDAANDTQTAVDPIELIDLSASTYKGKLLIVHDPSRLTVGVSGDYGASCSGKTVKDMAIAYNAVAAVNAGGFIDEGGMGNGGTPIGAVISEGKLKYGSLTTSYELIGFNKENKFIVGQMTGQQALDRGIRDAVSFGPILIVNGKASVVNGDGSGLNPRTAIGQRADGAILLLVIDGRQANSMGATYADLIDIMLQYGAVNAANLDGGSSTLLYYNGEYINNCSSLTGPRNLPTSIIVR